MAILDDASALTGRTVAVFAPSAYPVGGVAVWIDQLAVAVASVGARFVLAAPEGVHHDLARYRDMHPGVEIAGLYNPTGSHEGRVHAVTAMLQRLRPDVVLGANLGHLYPALHRYRRRAPGLVRVGMTLHGLVGGLLADLEAFRDLLDVVICTNRMTQAVVSELVSIDATRVLYAPYGVDLPSGAFQRHVGPRIRLAWVGRFDSEQKRCMDVPGILKNLQLLGVDFELRIAGEGPEGGALRTALEPWTGLGRVHWLGPLKPADMPQSVYRQSDILLITSEWETGPIVAWEAMSHGLAVVSSDYVGHRLEGALIDGETCVLFKRGDVRSAAARIASIVEPTCLERLAAAGQGLVAARYSQRASASAWLGALASILQQAPRPVPPRCAWRLPRSGRLDSLLGTRLAEFVRSRGKIQFHHMSAGGEWPHALSAGMPDRELVRLAEDIEARRGPA